MGLASTACLTPAGWLTSCLGGNSLNHVMNCVDVVYIEGCLHARSQVITFSSDASLIARAFGREALNLFSLHSQRNITRLLHHITTSSFYSFGSQFFELTNGMAVSSPLFLMIVSFMEDFGGVTLDRSMYKPLCSLCYVNDAFFIWPQGPEELKDFFKQFIREMEKSSHLSFPDMDIYRRRDGCLGHKSHHKPTHTTVYVNCGLCLLSSNNQALFCAFVHRARGLCHQDSLHDDWSFWKSLSDRMTVATRRFGRPPSCISCALNIHTVYSEQCESVPLVHDIYYMS